MPELASRAKAETQLWRYKQTLASSKDAVCDKKHNPRPCAPQLTVTNAGSLLYFEMNN